MNLADRLHAIIVGQRDAAAHREELADIARLAGDDARAEALYLAAAHARATAQEALRGFAKIVRAIWTSPDYEAQTRAIQAAAQAEREAQVARVAEAMRRAETRVVAKRKAAGDER